MAITLCNSGPLIALGKLNRLDLLSSVFAEVSTPRAVYREVVEQGLIHGASEASSIRYFWQQHRWPIIDTPEHLLTTFSPSVILDPGETEVLALATTYNDPLVLINDELARAEARRLRLRVHGTIGIISRPQLPATVPGTITLPSPGASTPLRCNDYCRGLSRRRAKF